MSHEWPSFRESSEPLSPTSTAPESRGIPTLQCGTSTSDTGTTTYASFTSITWPSTYSLVQSHIHPNRSPHLAQETGANIAQLKPKPDVQEHVAGARTNMEATSGAYAPPAVTLAAGPDLPKEDDDDDDMSGSDLDEIAEDEALPQTAAERRAAKRKMKRFRLTHNQTRFLLSEFARQPHPDAAQRERLSREIPGLSSRQVQVWFQNRRAKLKRLSVDDRERMMRSRALPENFDRSSALHAGLPATPPIGTHALSPTYGSFMGSQQGSLLRYRHIRRPSDDPATSPSSNPSMPSESLWTSGSMPGSEMQSPISPVGERGSVWGQIASQIPSPQATNSYGRSRSFPANYQAEPQVLRQYPPELASRMRAGSLASPVTASRGQPAPVPTVFGRPRPPALHDYSNPSQMGLPPQQQDVYPEARSFLPPQARDEGNPEQLIGRSPSFAGQPMFAIPPSPSVPQHLQPYSQEAFRQSQFLQQASPPVLQQEFTRPALPEQYLRPAYSLYSTHYPSQYTFEAASPQATNPEGVPYQMTRASISGPPTQRDTAPESGGTTGSQLRQQLRVDTGRRRSFTHPPDQNVLR